MKKIVKTITVTLIVGTTLINASSVEDYAFTKEYRLLNDMRLAQKQQELILKIRKELKAENVDTELLGVLKSRFSKVLNGLINGDKKLDLKGTKLPTFRAKLMDLKEDWKKESKLISKSLKNRDLKDRALAKLNSLMIKTSELIELYNQSYSRFKQKSKLSSIVYRHESKGRKKHLASI
jgi:hypothetical protein